MTIISVNGGEVPQGVFVQESTVIGANKDECLEALLGQCDYAQDAGASIRAEDGCEIYTMLGGTIR